ncbi:MAG: hypothetical protein NTZ16_08180 [Verrucomicrobia bacterium]|nr:hypothetical protein [Verrucomicrobiota bacterium]
MEKSNTTPQPPKTRAELESVALELIVACPLDSSNPQNCPLRQLREQPLTERVRWLRALADEELAYLVSYHQVCLNTKLQAEPLLNHWGRKLAQFDDGKQAAP